MHCSFTRHANMDKENKTAAKVEESTVRITRARSKAMSGPGGTFPSSKPSFKQGQKHDLRSKFKRAASDENKASVVAPSGTQHKRRAVLADMSNIVCDNSLMNHIHASKIQTRKQARRGPGKKNNMVVARATQDMSAMQGDAKTKLAEELSKIRMVESQDVTLLVNLEKEESSEQSMSNSMRECGLADQMPLVQASTKPAGLQSLPEKEDMVCKELGTSTGPDIVDIDSNLKDPKACSSYASDIHSNIRVAELDCRPSTNYMEKVQRDITPSMRGILIDWLVEVSEEYKLVPDTLYLTVNLIDRFLSKNYMEKTRLQLLGVTCMLIASKYEEICAPRVEEFCVITDNTYMRGEVLELERQVLNFLHFQLSVPSTKTFLRRFIQAAQASYKLPSVELEFLANYLAELTLVEYSFLKFLPSLIAAAAVFLAKWTLNQSDHPWNPTLEYYTSYKASELKTIVLALEELQLNTNGCSLNSIREKYRQQKFKCVATLTSPQPVSLFYNQDI
ncbi:cyclin-A2-2 [Corylus avellana]|uniref:cyclin-A2-2 n=1 Tax=Corylus avellana TaxID=13451 RepID=UPI00286AF529|nr:cyclin-A2-2 [Corylus avellana]XP_059461475.1 cyclin-A2-2 [Corylus avellana]XP_059461476.1 cyclin-A2-2 [Corylus avellana]